MPSLGAKALKVRPNARRWASVAGAFPLEIADELPVEPPVLLLVPVEPPVLLVEAPDPVDPPVLPPVVPPVPPPVVLVSPVEPPDVPPFCAAGSGDGGGGAS